MKWFIRRLSVLKQLFYNKSSYILVDEKFNQRLAQYCDFADQYIGEVQSGRVRTYRLGSTIFGGGLPPDDNKGVGKAGSLENGPYIKNAKSNGRPTLTGEKKLQFEKDVYNNNVDLDGILRAPNTGDVINWKPGRSRKGG